MNREEVWLRAYAAALGTDEERAKAADECLAAFMKRFAPPVPAGIREAREARAKERGK